MSDAPDREQIAEVLRVAGAGRLPGHLDLELVEISEGSAVMRCGIRDFHTAPNGYLHAGSVVALADTTAGYGVMGNLPAGATSFTTIELNTNFFSTLMEGTMEARATMIHGGRTTQVWDVTVSDVETEKVLTMFRCTQMILYPRT